MRPTTTTRSTWAGGSPSSASYHHHPPPPPSSSSYYYPGLFDSPPMWRGTGAGGAGGSCSSSPPPPYRLSSSGGFDFIMGECGEISPSQDSLLRGSPFIRQSPLPTDVQGLTNHILYRIFGSPAPHPSNPRRYSDAAAAELALVDYFLRLGTRRLHLLPHPRPPLEGEQAATGKPFPSEAATERPEGLPRPPKEARPSCRLGAAAVDPNRSSNGGKDKGPALKRGRRDSSSPAGEEHSLRGKKPCGEPDAANATCGICSQAPAAVIPTGQKHAVAGKPQLPEFGNRGFRKLPPSIMFPDNGEEWGDGDERSTRLRHRHPLPQMEQEAGKAGPVSLSVGRSLPAEKARAASWADAINVEERGPSKGDAAEEEPGYPSLRSLVEEGPPPRVGSHAGFLPSHIDAMVRFLEKPVREHNKDVDVLKMLATKGIQLWRPGGYSRPASPGKK